MKKLSKKQKNLGKKETKSLLLKHLKKHLKQKSNYKKYLIGFLALVLLFFLFLLFLLFGIYWFEWDNYLTRKASLVVPYPIASVSKKQVYLIDFYQRADAIKRYHSIQGVISGFENYDLASSEGNKYFQVVKKNLLERMIMDQVVDFYVKEYSLTPSEEDILQELKNFTEYQDDREKMEIKIQKVYGMSLGQFKKEVVHVSLKRKKLYEFLIEKQKIDPKEEGSFDDWLKNQSKNFKVRIFVRKYYWDQKKGVLRFKDEKMNQYEQEIIK